MTERNPTTNSNQHDDADRVAADRLATRLAANATSPDEINRIINEETRAAMSNRD